MIAVETVIRKLINEHEFVILPGFGALLSHQIPAAFDKNSGFFAPPAKKLAFNESLKLDDGFLANYISRHERVPHVEAVEYIKVYVDQLKHSLEATGTALINGVGEFGKNVEGKLIFQPNTGKYFKDEWYGFEKVKAAYLAQPVIKQLLHETASEEVAEVIEDETPASRRWIGWAAAAVIAGLLCGLSVFFVNSNGELKSTLNPFNDLFSRSYEKTDSYKTSTVEELPVTPAPVKVVIPAKVDSAVVAAPDVEAKATDSAVVNKIKPEITAPAPAGNAKFYVIAGAFKGPKQANVLLAQLKEQGFEKAFIIPAGKYSKKVKVAIDRYPTEPEAYKASKSLKPVIGEAGWVYKTKGI